VLHFGQTWRCGLSLSRPVYLNVHQCTEKFYEPFLQQDNIHTNVISIFNNNNNVYFKSLSYTNVLFKLEMNGLVLTILVLGVTWYCVEHRGVVSRERVYTLDAVFRLNLLYFNLPFKPSHHCRITTGSIDPADCCHTLVQINIS
jgi:hypothetical protein